MGRSCPLPPGSLARGRWAELALSHARVRGPQMNHSSPPVARMSHPNLVFWLSWVAASMAAILLGLAIIYTTIFLSKAIVPGTNEDRLAGAIMIPVVATVLGALQWLVLRTRIVKSGWWIVATAVGMLGGIGVAGGLVQTISRATGRQWNLDSIAQILVVYGLIGFVLAIAQLPVLWRHIEGVAFWPMMGIVGWLALGLLMGKSIDRISDVIALGSVPAAVTGLGLIWLIRGPGSHTIRSA